MPVDRKRAEESLVRVARTGFAFGVDLWLCRTTAIVVLFWGEEGGERVKERAWPPKRAWGWKDATAGGRTFTRRRRRVKKKRRR